MSQWLDFDSKMESKIEALEGASGTKLVQGELVRGLVFPEAEALSLCACLIKVKVNVC